MNLTATQVDRPVAIITGGASGIGRACCLRFAEEGAKIVVADINLERASAVADEITSAGGEAIALTVDTSIPEEVAAMASGAVDSFGRVDACVAIQWPPRASGSP